MTILATGLTGLIGSRVSELLSDKYSFENISRSTGVDVTKYEEVEKAISSSEAQVIIHLAAYTDVKKAETEKELGERSEAWQVNVIGTENIAKACKNANKKLLYISTDLVFDGENVPQGGYKEEDIPNPLNWYAKTKYEGELRVQDYADNFAILRIAYPYRANFSKVDFVRLFLNKLQNNEELTVLSDRIVTPTFIDDIADVINLVIQKNAQGIYHVVGSTSLSIYDCAKEISEVFGLNASLIHATTRDEFLVGRPSEPFDSSLNNAKIKALGVTMCTFKEGLEKIKTQLSYNN